MKRINTERHNTGKVVAMVKARCHHCRLTTWMNIRFCGHHRVCAECRACGWHRRLGDRWNNQLDTPGGVQ